MDRIVGIVDEFGHDRRTGLVRMINRSSMISMDQAEPLLSSGEVAKRLGVTAGAIGSWVRQGKLRPAVTTMGGRYRFRWSEVQDQLREQRERDE